MPVSAAALPVSAHDRAELRRWANASQAPATLVRRAKILLLAAEGVANTQIAERLEVSRPTVIVWRKRYAREGLAGGLADRHRRGRPQSVRRDRRAEIGCLRDLYRVGARIRLACRQGERFLTQH